MLATTLMAPAVVPAVLLLSFEEEAKCVARATTSLACPSGMSVKDEHVAFIENTTALENLRLLNNEIDTCTERTLWHIHVNSMTNSHWCPTLMETVAPAPQAHLWLSKTPTS